MIHLPALLGYMVHSYQLFMTMTVHVALKVVEECSGHVSRGNGSPTRSAPPEASGRGGEIAQVRYSQVQSGTVPYSTGR